MEINVDLKQKTIMVIDSGMFFSFALKLADYYKEVLYWNHWKSGYPRMMEAVIGTQWKDGKQFDTYVDKPLRKILNIFDHLDEVDMVVFLDVIDGDLAQYLSDQGIPVVGSKKGELLELQRWETKEMFKKDGMDVQPRIKITGLDALRAHLKTVENKWVKISTYRQTIETFHHINYKLTEPILDKLQYNLGPLAKIMEFVVEDNIDAIVEEGVDTYVVNGQHPDVVISGCEVKDSSYCCSYFKTEDLSQANKIVNKQMEKYYKMYDVAGFLSTEIRTTADGKYYALDPCMRLGSPPSELYQEMYSNLGEIVWGLGHGFIVNPEIKKKYGMQLFINSEWYSISHQAITFDPKYFNNIKLKNCVIIDDEYYVLKVGEGMTIGSIVAVADTIEECKKIIDEVAKTVAGQGIEININALDAAEQEFNKMLSNKNKQ